MGFANYIDASFAGAAPCITCTGATQVVNILVTGGSRLSCSGAGSFLSVTNGFSEVTVDGNSQIGDAVHAVVTATLPGAAQVFTGNGSARTGAIAGNGASVFWDVVAPQAQGAGVTVAQSATGNWQNPLQGWPLATPAANPLLYGVQPGASVALAFALTAAQYSQPVQVFTGVVPGGGTTVTFPSVVGAVWDIDLSQVTLTGTLTMQAGTGAGGTCAATAAHLAAIGSQGVRVACTAANKLVRVA